MYLIGALVTLFVGSFFEWRGIDDIPFSQLTLRMVSDSLISLIFHMLAMYLAVISLFRDMLWPWRWRWNRYFMGNVAGRVVLAVSVLGLAVYCAYSNPNMPGWAQGLLAVVTVIFGLSVLFSDEYTLFDENKPKD